MKIPEVGKTYRSRKTGRPTVIVAVEGTSVSWSASTRKGAPVYVIKLENFWIYNEEGKA